MILSLLIEGEEVVNFKRIANKAFSFYVSLYKNDQVMGPCIDNLFDSPLLLVVACEMEKHFSEEEVKEAILG